MKNHPRKPYHMWLCVGNFSAILPGEITHEDKCDLGVCAVWVTWSKKMIKVRLRQYRDTRRDIYLLFDVTSESALQSSFFLRCNQISKARLLAECNGFYWRWGIFSFKRVAPSPFDAYHWFLALAVAPLLLPSPSNKWFICVIELWALWEWKIHRWRGKNISRVR